MTDRILIDRDEALAAMETEREKFLEAFCEYKARGESREADITNQRQMGIAHVIRALRALPTYPEPLTRERLEKLMWEVQAGSYRDTKEAEVGLGYAFVAMRELIRRILSATEPSREPEGAVECRHSIPGALYLRRQCYGPPDADGGPTESEELVEYAPKFCPDCGERLSEA